jgi:alginate O-acetyltransferase complex protein AlgI
VRCYINLLVVFVLTGFWHGASWNFLVWGLIHGIFLIIERIGLEKWTQLIWAPLAHLYVMGVVLVGWVFFRAEDFRSAIAFLLAASNCLNRRLDEMAETF